MAGQTEVTRVNAFIFSRLHGDSVLMAPPLVGVFFGSAPEGTATTDPPKPYIVFANQGFGTDITTANGVRIFTQIEYLVKAIKRTNDMDSLDVLAARIDTLLNRSSGGTILSCIRTRPFELPERNEAGQLFSHLGGFYRFQVQ